MKKYLPKFGDGDKITTRDVSSKIKTVANPVKTINQTYNSMQQQSVKEFGQQMENAHDTRIKEGSAQGNPNGDPKKGLSEGAATGMSIGASIAGGVTDALSSAIDVDENSSFKQEQAVGDALLSSGNPYAMLAGAAVKLNSGLNQALGTNMNTISKKEASKAGIGGAGRLVNNVVGFLGNIGIPGIGAAFGKTDNVKMSEQTKAMGASYAGSIDDISVAEGMSEGRYVVGRDKINDMIREAKRQNYLITDIAQTNTQRKMSDYGTNLAQQNLNRYAGNNYQNTHIGKYGMKLVSAEEIRAILNARKEESDVQSFHNGGVIGIDVNVIPEGKYHAHKNHLEDVSEEFDDLTKKGIPVIAHSEGGEIEQVAEIEKMELIFRLEVTNKLEELFKDGSDEAMIEAGKLVAYEIIENTQDNSGEVLKDE